MKTHTPIKLVALLLTALALALSGAACEEKKPETKDDKAAAEKAEKTEGSAAEAEAGAVAPGEAEAPAGDEAPAEQPGAAAEGEAEGEKVALVQQPGATVGDRTICPVMGGEFEVKEDSPSVEHEGKKVFFCCAGCDTKFQEDPEASLAALKEKIDAANATE